MVKRSYRQALRFTYMSSSGLLAIGLHRLGDIYLKDIQFYGSVPSPIKQGGFRNNYLIGRLKPMRAPPLSLRRTFCNAQNVKALPTHIR
jgi:hypothetical protein